MFRTWLTIFSIADGPLALGSPRSEMAIIRIALTNDHFMDIQCYELAGVLIAEIPKVGDTLRSGNQAIDVISEVSACKAELIVVPIERLGDDFFRLRTQFAGEFLQKFATYRKRVAILGDISAYIERSPSFRDFVYECNAGPATWFVRTLDELGTKLGQRAEKV